ncbi:MAG: hypothetical protein ABJJ44_16695 [Paraglaciecola sp.]|uniref:hypothetical protein n=1 Tax=Paraglaciecola sp. TaxID=1920173 RepID=UPI00329762CF
MSTKTATIVLTKPDARFYVWFRNAAYPGHLAVIAEADLFEGQLDEEIDIVQLTMEVYVWFDFYQPNTKFTLKLGDQVIYKDELASSKPMGAVPKSIIVG